MGILPYKRGVHSHSLSNAKRNAGDHQGRAVGALAELLSCLPACPPHHLWVPVLPEGSQVISAQLSTVLWLLLPYTPTIYPVSPGSLLTVFSCFLSALLLSTQEGVIFRSGPVVVLIRP